MTAGQLIDALHEIDPSAEVVNMAGDGLASVTGVSQAGENCYCLVSRGKPDLRFDDEAVHAVNTPLREQPEAYEDYDTPVFGGDIGDVDGT